MNLFREKNKVLFVSLSFVLLALVLLAFALFYRSSESYLTANAEKGSASPLYTSKIKLLEGTAHNILPDISLDSFTGYDPMSLVDTSVDVYRAVVDIRVKDEPEEETYYFSLDAGEYIMIREELSDGWFLVQLANGTLGYINDLSHLEYLGYQDSGVTRHKSIPRDTPAYIVGQGDRVLRYRYGPELKNNAAAIIEPGTLAYALGNNGTYFRVILDDGRTGYLNSQCLQPVIREGYYDELPIVDGGRTTYGYQEMMDDIVLLLSEYPQYIRLFDVGKSELGRAIPVLLVGNEDAPQKLLVQAAIHGREYATTQILMKQLEIMLYHCDAPSNSGQTYESILEQTAFYIIPMSNPDGCMISMLGEMSIPDETARQQILDIRDANVNKDDMETYNRYFRLWKANFNGVDLNRNFDANWQRVEDSVKSPANEGYKGSAPFNQSESIFLKEYVERDDVAATISYHTSGAMIFWWYYQEGDLEESNYDLASLVYRYSGYPIMDKRESYGSHGGMKDYGIVLKKPSITIEMGYYSTPIPPTDVMEVMQKTSRLLPRLGSWLIRQQEELAE